MAGNLGARVWIALGTIYIVWGSTFMAIDLAVRTIPPFLAMGARHVFAGTVLLLWGLARGPRERIGRPQLVATAIFGLALFLGGHGSLAWAQQEIPSGVAALIIATIPLWVAIFDRLVFGKRLAGRAILGLAIGFGGVAVLVDPVGGGPIDTAAALVAVFAAASWAGGSLFSRDAPMPQNAMVAAGLASLFGGVALLAGAGVRGEYSGFDLSQVSAASAFGEVYVIVMGSFVGLTSYVWLLRAAPISLVATYAYVNPVIAVLIGALFLDETLPASILVAGAAIVAAVAMIVSAPAPARSHGRGLRRTAPAGEQAGP
jgi:drug/metabolite transporter (DMT)-like permease